MAGQSKLRVCLVAVDIRSTHNVGSLFRSCDGFGAELFLVGISPRPTEARDGRLPHVADKAHQAISKTALGAEKTVSWRYAETLPDCLTILKSEGFKIAAIEQSPRSRPIQDLTLTQSTALLVGREVDGLNSAELALCSDIYEISMSGQKESFNVAVAAGIALYQATIY